MFSVVVISLCIQHGCRIPPGDICSASVNSLTSPVMHIGLARRISNKMNIQNTDSIVIGIFIFILIPLIYWVFCCHYKCYPNISRCDVSVKSSRMKWSLISSSISFLPRLQIEWVNSRNEMKTSVQIPLWWASGCGLKLSINEKIRLLYSISWAAILRNFFVQLRNSEPFLEKKFFSILLIRYISKERNVKGGGRRESASKN